MPLVGDSSPSFMWGLQFVQQSANDSQFLVYDPSSRKQWTLTFSGGVASWDSYFYQCDTNPCVFQTIEPQIPFNLINKNRERVTTTRGNIRGRRNNRTAAQQRFRPTTQLLATKGRGECTFSYGKAFFYLDNDPAQPKMRRLQITASKNASKHSQSNCSPRSQYRRKWTTCTCFGQSVLCYGGTIVDLTLPQGTEKPLCLASPPVLMYDIG